MIAKGLLQTEETRDEIKFSAKSRNLRSPTVAEYARSSSALRSIDRVVVPALKVSVIATTTILTKKITSI